MTVKGPSSLQRTTYFHLCFHDSTLIFQKQLISLGSGITGFACKLKELQKDPELFLNTDLGFFDRLDFVTQLLDRFADVIP